MISIIRKNSSLLTFLGYSTPVAILLIFVTTFSVNVPYWDDWDLVDFYNKILFQWDAKTFNYFWAQHNEHRLFFPKIIFAALALLSKNNLLVIIYFNISILLLCGFLILLISQKQRSVLNRKNKSVVLFDITNIVSLFVFLSISQYENLIWGFQLPWFLISLCLLASVYLWSSRYDTKLKLMMSLTFCTVASFSSAFGLLTWFALIPSLTAGNHKYIIKLLSVWSFCFLICFFVYLVGYHRPISNADLLFVVRQPITATIYFLISIGSVVGSSNITCVSASIIILIIFAFFNIQATQSTCLQYKTCISSWLSIGWFGIIFNLLTTIGRGSYGIEQSMTSRYTTPTILLYVACVQMLFLFIIGDKMQAINKFYTKCLMGVLLGFFLALLITKYENVIVKAEQNKDLRLRGSVCLQVIDFTDSSYNEALPLHLLDKRRLNCLQAIHPNPEELRAGMKNLDRLGFKKIISEVDFIDSSKFLYGDINLPQRNEKSFTIAHNSSLYVSGWAMLPNQENQPQVIFFSHGNEKSFFADTLVHIPRADVVEVFKSEKYKYSGWEANISTKSLPIGEHTIKAWIFDKNAKQFIRLGGEPKIKIVE